MNDLVQDTGRQLVRLLHVLFKNIAVHDAQNRAVLTTLEGLRDAVASLRNELGGTVRLQYLEDVVYLNDRRLRVNAAFADAMSGLRADLASRGLGGIAFHKTLTVEQLRVYFARLGHHVETPEDAERVRRSVAELGDLGVELLRERKVMGLGNKPVAYMGGLHACLQAYARAVLSFRELLKALRAGRDPMMSRLHINRVVQDLIDVADERSAYLLKLPAMRHAAEQDGGARGDYASTHAANTCVYAIILGKAAGLSKLELLELGVAALLADVGFALLPPSLTERQGELNHAERVELANAMARGVQHMIGRGRASDAAMRRTAIAFEHHAPYADPATGQPAQRHLYSRIVGVADAFDALTSKRAWRPAHSHGKALAILAQEAGTRWDPMVVRLLDRLLTSFAYLTALSRRAQEASTEKQLPAWR